ncbi:MAG: S9 family peptidase [Planctomycetales bacterium]
MPARRAVRSKPPKKSAKSAVPKRALRPEDLLRLVVVSDPRMSPDGTEVLFARKHVGEKNDYVTNLGIVSAEGGDPRQFTSGGKDAHGRWSPDGSRIAFIGEREKSRPQIHLISASGGEAVALTKFPEGKIRAFKWSPDGTRLAVAFRETHPDWTACAKKDRERNGASTPPRVIENLYYRLDGDGYFGGQRHKLYVVDVATGDHALLFDQDEPGTFDFDWSPDSSELAVVANPHEDAVLRPWRSSLYRVNAKTGRAKELPGLPEGKKGAVRWSPDGKRIALSLAAGREIWGIRNFRLFVCDAEKGTPRDLFADNDYCLMGTTTSDVADINIAANLFWHPAGKQIFFQLGWHGEQHVASIGADGGGVVLHTSGRQVIVPGDFDTEGGRLALTVSDPLAPPEVAVLAIQRERGAGFPACRADDTGMADSGRQGCLPHEEPRTLTDVNGPLLAELELAMPEPVWLDTTSGTKLHAWIMRPPATRTLEASGSLEKSKHPAVIEVHGGPHLQYGETYFHEFQTLVAAGYVVAYPNPRGSKGYGEQHCLAVQANWGGPDWEDVCALRDHLKQQPDVDAKKLGIMGGSYGGFMTNWAIAHADDFAAAVTDRCVSNLVSMAGSSDIPLIRGGSWESNAWDDIEAIWEQSPLKHFAKVNTPTLVIHSEGDLRCNVEQGEQVFASLRHRGVPTRFVRYPPETSHGMSRVGPPDLRIDRLRRILEWWEQYLS